MATIKDIAKMLGVSISTVSYALNGSPKISKETRDKVLEAADQLEYKKNGFASDLKRNRTKTILFTVTDLAGHYYRELVQGIQEVVVFNGYDLVVCSAMGGDHSTAVKYLTEKRTDGAIILAHNISEKIISQSARQSFPIVLLDRIIQHEYITSIDVDNESGAHQATEYLIELGHKNIAYVSGVVESRLMKLRHKGYVRAMEEHGLGHKAQSYFLSGFNMESGYNSIKLLIAQGRLPSAICFANDEMAIGGIRAFHEAGIDVPNDISVIGFDDIELAQHIRPALTTIKQPKFERGAAAARLIFQRLEGHPAEQYVQMKTELIIRDSCKPL
ncbi:LacI family DNA-binding transcriptional regulator [Paenibacillus marinisediminis]